MDAADLFCEIYDEFEAPRLNPREVDDWLTDEQVIDISSSTEGAVLATGSLDRDYVRDAIEIAEDRDRRRYAYLQGIDNALLHVHPHMGTYDLAGLTAIATRYAVSGRFSTDAAPGALLPRFAVPPREQMAVESLAGTFAAVVRVPAETWDRLSHTSIPARSDFHRRDRERGILFGCVPFLDRLDDLEWKTSNTDGRSFLQTRVIPSDEVRERIGRVLRRLDEQGVMVGVLPESCASDQTLEWWREEIVAKRPPRDSRLRWIFAGTGPLDEESDPPRNSGVLLDRLTGDVLLTQDKMHRFVMDPELISSWGLSEKLGTGYVLEDITAGETLNLAECALGRLVILICEDLSRTMIEGPDLLAHGVSHVLCPVLSDDVEAHHWEHNKAKDYADQIGAQTVVANSRMIGCNQGTVKFGTALAHSPRDRPVIGETEAVDDVVLLRLSDETAINAIARTAGFEDFEQSQAP